jgi:hypothetical protein
VLAEAVERVGVAGHPVTRAAQGACVPVQRCRVVGQRPGLRGRLVMAMAQLVVDGLEHQQLRIGWPLAGRSADKASGKNADREEHPR